MNFHELNEKAQRGSSDFPIQFYALTQDHPRYEMELHWHKEFELIRVLAGQFHLFLQNTEYVLAPGDIALVSSGMLHRGTPDCCQYECIVFDLNMLRRYAGGPISTRLMAIMSGHVVTDGYHPADSQPFCETVHQLFDCLKNKPAHYEFTVYGLLYALFGTLLAQSIIRPLAGERPHDRKTEVITTLLNWIELHFREPVTLSQLAEIAGLNEKYLCRLFKDYTDRTPIDYVNNLRIEQACREIQENGLSVTDAAYESGFNDLSYFSRAFKKYKGCSPSRYKKC